MNKPTLIVGSQDQANRLFTREKFKSVIEEFYNHCHVKGKFGDKDECGDTGTEAHPVGKRLATAKPQGQGAAAKSYRAGEGPKMSLDLVSSPEKVVLRQAAVPGFEDITVAKYGTPEKAMEEIIKRQEQNIFDYADAVVGASRQKADATADWYPFTNKYMTDLAKANGIPPEAAIACTAALSASASWESNVPWAKYLIENVSPEGLKQKVDPKWIAAQYTAALSSYNFSLKQGKTPKSKPDPEEYKSLIGKTLGDLTDVQIAVALRGKHEASGTGKGAEGKLVRQLGDEVHAGFGKKGAGTVPQTAENMAKAISVIRDPSPENIDRHIGNQNKVRSFYQNLRDPKDTEYEDVTVDTHHFGVANHAPWTMSSRFIKGKQEVANSPGNAATGALGTYPLVVEATRRAAQRINEQYGTNYTPNQIQSIVWEHHKEVYPPKIRSNKALQDSVDAANTEFAKSDQSKSSKKRRDDQIETARLAASTKNLKVPTMAEILKKYKEYG